MIENFLILLLGGWREPAPHIDPVLKGNMQENMLVTGGTYGKKECKRGNLIAGTTLMIFNSHKWDPNNGAWVNDFTFFG